jgi:D-serine deaminase-like pyridoxal phosphate-dependent protein
MSTLQTPVATTAALPPRAPATSLAQLDTPALVLDRLRMERNIAAMRANLGRFDVTFRPHVKTSKSIDAVLALFGGQPGPITVSTLKEADHFAAHGFTDILYAVGVIPAKLEHVARLAGQGVKMTVLLDSPETARGLCERAAALGASFDVLIEIDCDGHRSGVEPASPVLLEIAAILAAGGQNLAGVLTHAGDSYNCRSIAAIKLAALQERDAVVLCASRLRAAGFSCATVSIGSTPTALFADNLDGVTEVRAGVFVFGDLVMAGLGVCTPDQVALSVLATVIGHQKEKGWVLVDAGWMAMSRDRGTSRQPVDQGYGLVTDLHGAPIADLMMIDANQEHGILAHRSRDPLKTPMLPVGSMVRILPNHACATGAQHGAYQVVRGADTAIEAVWQRSGGW